MAEIKIGQVVIKSNGRFLNFQDQDQQKISIDIEASAISDLVEFLRSLKVDENQKRNAFRVPLSASSDLSTILGYGGKTSSVKPLNISITGIMVEFDSDDVYDMAIGAEVNLTLKMGDKTTEISGIIARRDGNRYGIFFPEALDFDKAQPPAPLQSIVAELERNWLRMRIR